MSRLGRALGHTVSPTAPHRGLTISNMLRPPCLPSAPTFSGGRSTIGTLLPLPVLFLLRFLVVLRPGPVLRAVVAVDGRRPWGRWVALSLPA